MDKYTKTINALKKEYKQLQKNKNIKGGAELFQYGSEFNENIDLGSVSNTTADGNIASTAVPASRTVGGSISKVELDKEYIFYNDNNFVFPRENKNYMILNCMLFNHTDFI
tara:strand:- start:365 stop:697 length:333 start_codon:yes stop_codon:yes gene_type:complete